MTYIIITMAPKKSRRPKRKSSSKMQMPLTAESFQPAHRDVVLKYVDTGSITVTSGALAFDTWALNSMFDPYVGIGGHQPYLFDQLSLLYQKYVVSHVEVILNIAPSSTTSWVGMRADDDNINIPVTISQEKELQNVVIKTTSTDDPVILRKTFHVDKIFGISKTKLFAENTYASAVTADPATLAKLYVFHNTVAGGTNTLYYNIELRYHARFYSREELPQS